MPVTGPNWNFFGIPVIGQIVAGIWAFALIASFAALLISGGVFAFSGENPQRREGAMSWIRNSVVAVLLLAAAGALWAFLFNLGGTA